MFYMYNGYSIGPGPNDPGVIIRLADQIVGSAVNYNAAYRWVDAQLAAKDKAKK